MDSSMKTQCINAVLEAGDLHLSNSNERAYRFAMDIDIYLGGFVGYVDEVRISNVNRYSPGA